MNMKDHILAELAEQLGRWEALLAGLKEARIVAPRFDHDWSIKDVVAHLWAWQQVSVARLEAAALDRDPELPEWLASPGSDWEEDADRTNTRIYEALHALSWTDVHRGWREGFQRLLDLGRAVSEMDLLDADRYSWLAGYSLAFVLVASRDHHQEHLDKLRQALQEEAGWQPT
jgi:hypothetical protein